MGERYSALLRFYVPSVMIMSAVLAIHSLPKESPDWCAKDNATRYVAPPPDPVPSQLQPFPSFSCVPMTNEECDKMGLLMIPECIGKSVVDLNLKHSKRGENSRIYRNISLGIPTIRADRAVSFGIWDLHLLMSSVAVGIDYNILEENRFLRQAMVPMRKNIIEFTIYKCSYRCPSKLPALQLTSLLRFTVEDCDYSSSKPVTFRRADFVNNIRLRAVVADECAYLEIERFTFTSLPDLRLLALEKNFFKDSTAWGRKDTHVPQLRKLHCECRYAWLRDLFRVNPGLVSAKPAGYIYEVCEAVSPEFKKEDIFVPVNCSKEISGSRWDYDWKKSGDFFGDAQRLSLNFVFFTCTTLLVGLHLF